MNIAPVAALQPVPGRAPALGPGPSQPATAPEASGPGDSVRLSERAATAPPAATPQATATPAPAPRPATAAAAGTELRMGENGTLAAFGLGGTERDEKFLARYGPWAVVTGASQGIGAEFARVLAEKGMNVVLVARSAEKLAGLSRELQAEQGVEVRVVAQDLSRPEGLQALQAATGDLEVGLLVNNAGMWQFGSFLDNDIQKDVNSVALNVEAPMVLSHHYAGKMAGRGRGGVINVGSGAALHGVPGQAAYSATKGFLQNFSQSLYRELKPRGVDVLITNPGPVEGEASAVYDQSRVPLQKVTGRDVVVDALKSLGHGSTTIPGRFNRLAMNLAVRAMPRDLLTGIAGYILKKASDS